MFLVLALVYCSLMRNLDGGSGCTACPHSRTLSRVYLLKVSKHQIWYQHVLIRVYILAIGKQEVVCAPKEFSIIQPPSGQSCSQYMGDFISSFGGYLENPDATGSCQFCAVRTTDEYLGNNFDFFYSNRWRNVGILLGVSLFNVSPSFFICRQSSSRSPSFAHIVVITLFLTLLLTHAHGTDVGFWFAYSWCSFICLPTSSGSARGVGRNPSPRRRRKTRRNNNNNRSLMRRR